MTASLKLYFQLILITYFLRQKQKNFMIGYYGKKKKIKNTFSLIILKDLLKNKQEYIYHLA